MSTEDCKRLLIADPLARLAQADQASLWKRLSKRSGPLGIERVFACSAKPLFALVAEDASGLWVAAMGSTLESLSAPSSLRSRPISTPMALAPSLAPSESADPASNSTDLLEEIAEPLSSPKCTCPQALRQARDLISDLMGEPREGESESDFEAAMERGESRYDLAHDRIASFAPGSANQLAFANQFLVAILGAEDGPDYQLIISPARYFDQECYVYDQHINLSSALPEGCQSDMESFWDFPASGMSPLAALERVTSMGYVWREDFQVFCDAGSDLPGMLLLEPELRARREAIALARESRPAGSSASGSSPRI